MSTTHRPLTREEIAAYRSLARAARKLREAQERAEIERARERHHHQQHAEPEEVRHAN